MHTTLRKVLGVLVITVTLMAAAGCGSKKPMLLDTYFQDISVDQSQSDNVINQLPKEGAIYTDRSMSVYRKQGWSRELGLVAFSETDSKVERKSYIQRRSDFMKEDFQIQIQTIMPAEVLEKPYETDHLKNQALLRYCNAAMINDSRPYNGDRETLALVGLARSVIDSGVYHYSKRPRDAQAVFSEEGFDFEHGTLQKCHLKLMNTNDSIYTVQISTKAIVDPLTSF